jgi:hypothetical protein
MQNERRQSLLIIHSTSQTCSAFNHLFLRTVITSSLRNLCRLSSFLEAKVCCISLYTLDLVLYSEHPMIAFCPATGTEDYTPSLAAELCNSLDTRSLALFSRRARLQM